MRMKLLLIVIAVTTVFCNFSKAQNKEADKIVGLWYTTKKDGLIEIFKFNNRYYGKLVWGDEMYEADGKTAKKDTKNEDETKRNRSLKNLLLLTNFEYHDGVWEDGEIYDPQNGKTYSCILKLDGNKLHVRGYIGISLIGRTEEWSRKEK